MSKLITFSGKGGVGKTTTAALLIDELARFGFQGRLLVVDGDPATTLYLALGLTSPAVTLADVRDELQLDAKTVRGLPGGQTPAQFVARQLLERQVLGRAGLRRMAFDTLALGWPEGRPGCYCGLNTALSQVLNQLLGQYDLVIIDNEAGLEHLSRHRVGQVHLFVTVETDQLASRIVARRIEQVARTVGMEIGEVLNIRIGQPERSEFRVVVPVDPEVAAVQAGVSAVSPLNPCRRAIYPLIVRALALSGSFQPLTTPWAQE
jgi:CO dehydrogenase maturation factor